MSSTNLTNVNTEDWSPELKCDCDKSPIFNCFLRTRQISHQCYITMFCNLVRRGGVSLRVGGESSKKRKEKKKRKSRNKKTIKKPFHI